MSLTLKLGVMDIPYASKDGKTTGDVAEILEAKYHVMEIFAREHMDDIAEALADGFSNSIAARIANPGSKAGSNIWGGGTSVIEDLFKQFLTNREMDAMGYPGVPTKASGYTPYRKGGINHRLKHPYRKSNPPRPSFIDTGEYQASFKATVEAS